MKTNNQKDMENKYNYKEIDNIIVADWAYAQIKEIRDSLILEGNKETGYIDLGLHLFYLDTDGKITQTTPPDMWKEINPNWQ